MGYKIVEFQETPNPNALKCVLDRRLGGDVAGLRSYQSAQAAAEDALGRGLLAIPGVNGVLIHSEWVTVNRIEGAEWKGIKAAVGRVLAEFPGGETQEGSGA